VFANRLDGTFRRVDPIKERNLHRLRAEGLRDTANQRPERREDQHLFFRCSEHADRAAESTGRPGGDHHRLPLAGQAIAVAYLFDDRIDQGWNSPGRCVAVQLGVVLRAEVFHPPALKRLEPGVTDVERARLVAGRVIAPSAG